MFSLQQPQISKNPVNLNFSGFLSYSDFPRFLYPSVGDRSRPGVCILLLCCRQSILVKSQTDTCSLCEQIIKYIFDIRNQSLLFC